MSAELLRRAAKVLREHAEVAMPGKWLSLDAGDRLIAVKDDFGDFEYLVTEEPARDGETADYIALMHPPVALALAEWLERESADYRTEVDRPECPNCGEGCGGHEEQVYHEACGDPAPCGCIASAIAVARAILRESP